MSVDAAGPRLRRDLEPRPVGWVGGAPERRRVPRQRRSTPTRSSCSTGRPGRLLWHDQVVRHDVRDYDFHVTPILVARGRPPARDRGREGRSRRGLGPRDAAARLVALRRHPPERSRAAAARRATRVCPGLFGGVLTPMALRPEAALRPGRRAVHERERSAIDVAAPATARGRRGASSSRSTPRTGRRLWQRRSALRRSRAPPCRADVVFVPTYDGWITRVLRPHRARRSGATARRRGSTAARPSRATCCSCRRAHRTATSRRCDTAARRVPARPQPYDRRAPMAKRRWKETAQATQAEQFERRGRDRRRSSSRTSRPSIHGKTEEIKLVLAALASGGHVLFEDVPGTAKTVLARSIAGSIEGAAWAASSARPTSSRRTSPGCRSSTSRRASSSSAPGRCSRTSCSSTRSTARCRRRSRRCSRRWPSGRRRSTAITHRAA